MTPSDTPPDNRPGSPAARAGLRRDDAMFGLLVDTVQDYAVFALDPRGHVLSWNEGARLIKGYESHEIVGRHFSTFYPAKDIAAGKPEWELEVAVREGRMEDEGWRLRKDGTRFWANVVITTLRDAGGAVVGFAKVTRDLTERRAAEETLRASEERFRLLVQSVKDYGIFILDPCGYVTSWNDGAQRIKGYTAQEIIGRHFSTFYPYEDVAARKPQWELEVATRDERFEDEGWRVRKDGTQFWAHVVITPLRAASGDSIGFAKVTRDLTERRAAQERALADARRVAEAEAANRAKGDFLAAMSHELRTPLNAIGGYADLLDLGIAGTLSQQQRNYLGRIRDSQQHLLAVINDLLNYSRMEAGEMSYHIVQVDVQEVVELAFGLLHAQATLKGLTMDIRPGPADAIAMADRIKTDQILLNLLSNALKFTPAGGAISLAWDAADDSVIATVQDTGVGIPESKLASIFEPFVQLGRNLSSPHEGTGLGLAISRDLARAMHGELSVTSEVHVGSTFTLRLPRAR